MAPPDIGYSVLRLRPNLVCTPQADGPRTCYVLQDPVSLRYFRLEEKQRYVVERMDGTHTLEDIRRAYEQGYRASSTPPPIPASG